jgi:hypothetical protein
MRRRVKQGTENARSRNLEFLPELLFGAPVLLGDRRQREKDCAVGQVRATDDILDAV